MSAVNSVSEESIKMIPKATKSAESVYSLSSSKYSISGFSRRKNLTRFGYKPAPLSGEIQQRVLSARRLRIKSLQNQITDAQLQIAELEQENRILQTLHKRQDNALLKYESLNAELPQLLHGHAEEIRVWKAKYRAIQQQNKELAYRLKQKDSIILSLSDENKHLQQLNSDKHLEDRERLTKKVMDFKNQLSEKTNDLKLMSRRMQLENKKYKALLQNEQLRCKEITLKLEKSKNEVIELNKIDSFKITEKLGKMAISLPTPKLNKSNGISKSNEITPKKLNDDIIDSQQESFINSQKNPDVKIESKNNDLNLQSTVDPTSSNGNLDKENTKRTNNNTNQSNSKENFNQELYENDVFDDDDDSDNDEVEIISTQTKNDLDYIRKQIRDEMQARESYLDEFCRMNSIEALKDEVKPSKMDPARKSELLAALKALEYNSSKESY